MKLTKLAILFTTIIGLTVLIKTHNSNQISKGHSEQMGLIKTSCKTTISGEILDKETKTPILNAQLILILNNEEIKNVTVDKNGAYLFKVNCNNEYTIKVKATSYFNTVYKIKTPKDDSSPIFKNFLLEKSCYQTISGKIINEFSNKAINNATVTLYLDGEEIETSQVDRIGIYSFRVKCNSNYYIVANKLNFTNDLYEFSTTNASNKNLTHDFKLEPECIQTLSGIIKNSVTLEPLSATLKLYLNNIEIETININNDGKYLVKFQCTTNYKIVASKTGYKEDSYNFLTDYTENKQPNYFHLKKDLILEPVQCFETITGKILNKKTNQIIPNSTVSLYYQNQEIKTYPTKSNGIYKFNVKCNETYEIKATKIGMLPETIPYITKGKNGDKETLNIYLNEESCNQIVGGTITDKNTQLPIANTKVSLLENESEINSVTTFNNGEFSFKVNCDTSYKIEAKNTEYNTNLISFNTDKKRDGTITKSIALTPLDCNQIASGTITDKITQLPIANTKVSLLENDVAINSVTTSENGEFSFKVNCDTSYKIEAKNTEYNANRISLVTDKNRDGTINKSIALTPLDCNQIASGTITDKITQLPIANTKVSLLENDLEINSVTTSNNGEYRFKINCNTSYKIEAKNTEYNTNLISFNTDKKRDGTITKSIVLTPLDCNQIVSGTITDKNTQLPIANTKVSLLQNDVAINSVTTSENGEFSFKVNCNSSYKIEAKNTEYNANLISLVTDKTRNKQNNVNLKLGKKECSQIVTGIIRDKITKAPLPNTTITLYQNNNVIGSKIVGENGEYKFELKCSSTYKLSVFKNNRLESFRIKTAVENGRTLHLNFDIEPQNCVQYLNGIVLENVTNNVIPGAEVKLMSDGKTVKSTFTDSNGTFYFEMKCNKNYMVNASKNNYTISKKPINTIKKLGHPYSMKLLLEPIIKIKEKNKVKYIETKPINFELDESKLTREAAIELNKVVFNLHQNPSFKIEINCYTDSRGPDQYNMELTKNRAEACENYLISKGIDPSRIKATGYGETHLLNRCKNNVKCTDAEHSINKRVDFIIIPN